MEELRKSLARVKRVRRKIQSEFASLEDAVLKQFLGEFDSPELRQQVRDYGDGHFLYPLPSRVNQLTSVDAGVLFAMTSPKLGSGSNFKPTTPIHQIPYWRDTKRLVPQTKSQITGREYRLHFMVWQQRCEIHGKDDNDGLRRRRLLLAHRPILSSLFGQMKECSAELVRSLSNQLRAEGKAMVVITPFVKEDASEQFDELITGLVNDPSVIHIEAQLRHENFQIMVRISKRLP